MIVAILAVAVGIALLVLTAAGRSDPGEFGLTMAWLHMGLSALMALVIALVGLNEARAVPSGADQRDARVAAVLSRYMGLIWGWGALALAATYGTGMVTWHEWMRFLAAFVVLAGASFFIARRHDQIVESGQPEPRFATISRYLGIALLFGAIVVMLGLLIDGKMARFLEVQRANWQDWAANNYFFFGAMALAIVAAYGLFGVSRASAAHVSET